jgi:excisionase family DNA binding protein
VDKLLSPEEAGEILGIGAEATRRLCSDGHLTHIRWGAKGARIRIRRRDLDAFIDAHEVPAADRSKPVLDQLRRRKQSA